MASRMTGNLTIVVGAQWGDEGKGRVVVMDNSKEVS
jgi:adenylosuccinate synthase